MNERYYTGVGSRDTPEEILALMRRIGAVLGRSGWTLRSGGAKGADVAFEQGAWDVGGKRRIYLPKRGFGPMPRGVDPHAIVPDMDLGRGIWDIALDMAEPLHPAWVKMGDFDRRLMGRNVFQVLGDGLRQPSSMLVCYGEKPKMSKDLRCVDVSGGTGLAVRLAAEERVPVHNLYLPEHRARIEAYVVKQEMFHAAAQSARAPSRRPSP